jgi:hypothetical protein
MSYGCRLSNGMILVVDIIFDKSVNGVNIQMTGPNEAVLNYFNHALAMIANLWDLLFSRYEIDKKYFK